jgi:DNA-binding NarL/FixJ family response regulator
MEAGGAGQAARQRLALDPTNRVIRAAVCDGRRWFREALARRLNAEPDVRVLWTMGTLEELDATPWVADVLVVSVDEYLDRRHVEQLAVLCRRHGGTPVIGLTAADDDVAMVWNRLHRTGIATLVSRGSGVPALVEVLRQFGGDAPVEPERRAERRTRALLSPREQEVLEWLAAGRTVNEIADVLGLRPKTVANCKQRLYRKLGVHHQAHAVATALSLGLLVPGAPGP